VKRILLIGAGHAHLVVLKKLAEKPLYGARFMIVTPQPRQIYSGMLPGLIAGHYRLEEIEVDVHGLAARASAEYQQGELQSLDLGAKTARLRGGAVLEYDFISLNAGSLVDQSIPGAAEHALPVKPFHDFIGRLSAAPLARIAVVGAGAAGMELAMALRYRGAGVTLYSDRPVLSAGLVRRASAAMRRVGVDYRPGMAVSRIEAGPVVVSAASSQEFDAVVLATGARPVPWLRESGLTTDEPGFALVDDGLRSLSHPDVFAAGDCATLRNAPHPKSGVYSVRHGEILDENLRNVVARLPLMRYAPQASALSIIACGAKYAIAERGDRAVEGGWVWRWKDWIDKRWMKRLAS
jgi:pyridine nucleotide-disulfide oxidoreductase family protein